ncbi:hypothetical protein [Phormidium sp. FACHB-1136]|uniref:hypothetical protein n=1 Tax=Phormidium sp. FACHB-1136 TaxID=2692848 RepID=UPI001686EE27|nr:hypothetical protein [Phormidium sp. FACHB-1136]MBD2428866.1 hypothetical protein [Phormidium sp. FACHB-1136]
MFSGHCPPYSYSLTGRLFRNPQPDVASAPTTNPEQPSVRLMFATPEALPWPD